MNATTLKRSESTADELVAIAERMFAAQGVENVALTQIVAASGQKNRSAVHYHFGSREGVLSAVLDRRLVLINDRRHELLEALPRNAPPLAVVRADIAALAEAVVEEPWGPDYLSILAQVTFHPQLLGERMVREELLTGLRLARRRLEAAYPEVPSHLLGQRLVWLRDSVVFALARWVRDMPAARRTPPAMAALIDQLAAYGAAGVAAPVPPGESHP